MIVVVKCDMFQLQSRSFGELQDPQIPADRAKAFSANPVVRMQDRPWTNPQVPCVIRDSGHKTTINTLLHLLLDKLSMQLPSQHTRSHLPLAILLTASSSNLQLWAMAHLQATM